MNEYDFSERHLGTDTTISLICENQIEAESIAKELFATISSYEKMFSRFLPDSELSQLNQSGRLIMSDVFLSALTKSIDLAKQTELAFNPLVQIASLGYQTNFPDLPKEVTETNTNYNTNLSEIEIEEKTNIVTLAPNQKLDFGGFLKGYLASQLAEYVAKTYPNCGGMIINLGGDIATKGHDELHEPFIFLLYNPITGTEVPIALTDTALATSGTYARQWETSTGVRHHIIDSQTNQNPKTDLVSVSIVHSEGGLAEALTKLFITRGIETAIKIAPPQKYQYQYFCVTTDGKIISTIS